MWILIIGWVLKSCGYTKHVAESQNCGNLNSWYSKLVGTYKMRVCKNICGKSKMWVLNNCEFSKLVDI